VYLGGKDFLRLGNLTVYHTRAWTCDIELRTMILSATTLAALLAIGGVEINLGPGVEIEKIIRVLCSGCDKNMKSGLNVTHVDVGSIIAVAT
jgi:hypothetical protein